MAIRATFQLERPRDMDATLSMTMPLRDWEKLANQLEATAYPAWKMRDMIRQMVDKALAGYSDTEMVTHG